MLQQSQKRRKNINMVLIKSIISRSEQKKNPTTTMGEGTPIPTPLSPSTIFQKKKRLENPSRLHI
jgi:hypothetical protein